MDTETRVKRDTLVKIADKIAPYVSDTDSMVEADCTTELEKVLYNRLCMVRKVLEEQGVEFGGMGAILKD